MVGSFEGTVERFVDFYEHLPLELLLDISQLFIQYTFFKCFLRSGIAFKSEGTKLK